MAPDPHGERIARLEGDMHAFGRNNERIEGKLDQVLTELSAIKVAMGQRSGAERVGIWFGEAVRMAAIAIVSVTASAWIGLHR